MFDRLINLISGDYNKKQIDKLLPIVTQINNFYEEYETLSDDEVKAKTEEFKTRISNWETLDQILPEAFATVKQACKRMVGQEVIVKWETQIWNMIPYDVQLIWWMILHNWTIAEMKTGEWKTLVAVLPVYLNALTGGWVHVVTVNDYLASRDAQWMWHVYNRLGLTVGCVTKQTPLQRRREEYSKDITYVENSELWFDYLRDNLVKTMKERWLMWRPLNYAIVDEIDSILIDEARTPLIISEPNAEATDKYVYYAKIIKWLQPCTTKKKVSKWLLQELVSDEKPSDDVEDWDYYIDEKTKTASLSSRWIQRLEDILWVENLYRDIGYEEIHHIENALRAESVYLIDREYIVKDNEVLIVDEHTGRTMQWRRFSEWLHQAIEAKEWVEIQRESKTLATITYQNFFKQYKKLCGMTGTATTEWEEFEKIYELSVLEVPTNKPTIRIDKNDKVYFNQQAKWKFVKEYIKFAHEIGQPILIWTSAIDTSEFVSRLLEKENIVHYVLNAKYHEQEAHIVSQAGKFKNVVVATNMAWRWTDIKLEKWLNEKLAENYANYIKKQLKNQTWVSAFIYSSLEFELTIDAIKRIFNLTEEQILDAQKRRLDMWDGAQFKIVFNTNRKSNLESFAQLIFKCGDKSMEEREFHYGLFILWTEKHESRRIDNQLRWRAGRQWDPGFSVFFVALDDMIMKKIGGERIQSMASLLLSKNDLENLELTQKQFTNSIVRAQKQMEWRHFGIRKHLFEYDNVINKQRQAIYRKRDQILQSEFEQEKKDEFVNEVKDEIRINMVDIIEKQISAAQQMNQSVTDYLAIMKKEFSFNMWANDYEKFVRMDYKQLLEELPEYMIAQIEKKFENIDNDRLYQVMREIYLYNIDTLRVKHIDEMEYLRDKVWLMWYAQLDPLVVYKTEAYEKFQTLLYRLKFDITSYIVSIDFEALQKQEQAQRIVINAQNTENEYLKILEQVSKDVKEMKKSEVKSDKRVFESEEWIEVFEANDEWTKFVVDNSHVSNKVRPNDPCPCGSGKKYKKCCGMK